MSRIVLVLILFPTALSATAQKNVGIRLGVGNASLAVPGYIDSDPCPPEADCLGGAADAVRGLILGADLDLPVPNSSGALGLRIGAAYAQKGGAGSGRRADGEPDRGGTLSTSYLQFSALLRARTAGPQSLVVLLGPWVGRQLSCEIVGDLAAACGMDDAGVAMGAGVEMALPGSSSTSVGVEGIYYRGLKEQSRDERTRFVAVQAGFVFPLG